MKIERGNGGIKTDIHGEIGSLPESEEVSVMENNDVVSNMKAL